MKQLSVPGRKAARAAVDGHSFPAAVGILTWLRQLLNHCVEVIGHKKIELTVSIVVYPGASGTVSSRALCKSGLLRHVGEGAVAIVVIKHIVTVVGDKDVVKTVVIIVSYCHCRRPTGALEPCSFGHIREGAITIVLIEAIRRAGRSTL